MASRRVVGSSPADHSVALQPFTNVWVQKNRDLILTIPNSMNRYFPVPIK